MPGSLPAQGETTCRDTVFLPLFFCLHKYNIVDKDWDTIWKLRQMTAKKATHKYSYKEELLVTQLEILQHGLDLITQEIYENTGQLLSLVKLNLGKLLSAREGDRELMLLQSKKMVSQVILDLRKIS